MPQQLLMIEGRCDRYEEKQDVILASTAPCHFVLVPSLMIGILFVEDYAAEQRCSLAWQQPASSLTLLRLRRA